MNSVQEKNRIEQEKQEQILAQEEEEKLKQAEIEAHKLTYEETVCYYAIEYFKTILKDPDSLQINEVKIARTVFGDPEDSEGHYSEYVVILDYSAQNGFGGTNRETYYITMSGNKVSEHNSSSQEGQSASYIDSWIINVSTDKIKYAIDHPEALDY